MDLAGLSDGIYTFQTLDLLTYFAMCSKSNNRTGAISGATWIVASYRLLSPYEAQILATLSEVAISCYSVRAFQEPESLYPDATACFVELVFEPYITEIWE